MQVSWVAPSMAGAPLSIHPSAPVQGETWDSQSSLRHGTAQRAPGAAAPADPAAFQAWAGPLPAAPRRCAPTTEGEGETGTGHQKRPISPRAKGRIWLKTHARCAAAAAAETNDQQPQAGDGAGTAPVPAGSGPDPDSTQQPRGTHTSTRSNPPVLPFWHQDPSFPPRAPQARALARPGSLTPARSLVPPGHGSPWHPTPMARDMTHDPCPPICPQELCRDPAPPAALEIPRALLAQPGALVPPSRSTRLPPQGSALTGHVVPASISQCSPPQGHYPRPDDGMSLPHASAWPCGLACAANTS